MIIAHLHAATIVTAAYFDAAYVDALVKAVLVIALVDNDLLGWHPLGVQVHEHLVLLSLWLIHHNSRLLLLFTRRHIWVQQTWLPHHHTGLLRHHTWLLRHHAWHHSRLLHHHAWLLRYHTFRTCGFLWLGRGL